MSKEIIQEIEKRLPNTLLHALGIEITKYDAECVEGKMPVDQRTHQPMGLLHGGASVAFAESLCSIGAVLNIDVEQETAVGIEINANHVKSMRSGWVFGQAKILHKGRRTQLWSIEIRNTEAELVSVSRCTVAIVERR